MSDEKKEKQSNPIKILKEMASASVRSIRFCLRNAKAMYLFRIVSMIVSACLPFVLLWNWQRLIELLPGGIGGGVFFCVGLYLAIKLLTQAMSAIENSLNRIGDERMQKATTTLIVNKLATLDIGKYDDPSYTDLMSVGGDTPEYSRVANSAIYFVQALIVCICAIAALTAYYPLAAAAMFALSVPAAWLRFKSASASTKLWMSQWRTGRKMAYFREMLTDKRTAPELRLYGYEDFFNGKYEQTWLKLYRESRANEGKNQLRFALGAVITAAGLAVPIACVAADIAAGTVSAGSVSMLIGLAL